ncbi:MAG: MBL fold metallo-hydrolase [Verrucomicrobiaceae bacterium]|nr:MBL fold metallo-hydrolase [Verrucomicrobiaceae bacterium]
MEKLKSVVWLCQAGFLFELENTRVVVDPYLTNSCGKPRGRFDRMVPPPMTFDELKPDYVLFSHDHRDHYDDETVPELYKRYQNCFFAGPVSTCEHFKNQGFSSLKFQTLTKGNSYDFNKFKVLPTTAYHSDPQALGYVFDFGGKKVYFSGDSEYSDTLAEDIKKVSGGNIDIVFVVINGKLGNMNWQQAVKLVSQLKPRVAVPMHYGLFAQNTEDPNPFKNELERLGVKCVLFEAGKPQNI